MLLVGISCHGIFSTCSISFYFHPLLSTPKLAKTDASLVAPPKSDPGAIGRLRSFGSSCHLQSLQVQCMELLRVGRVGRFDDPTSKANGRGQHVDLRQTLEPSPTSRPYNPWPTHLLSQLAGHQVLRSATGFHLAGSKRPESTRGISAIGIAAVRETCRVRRSQLSIETQ